ARTGRQAGTYLARYRRSHGLELGDALIAAAATTAGLRLWTLNRRHYPLRDVSLFHALGWDPPDSPIAPCESSRDPRGRATIGVRGFRRRRLGRGRFQRRGGR